MVYHGTWYTMVYYGKKYRPRIPWYTMVHGILGRYFFAMVKSTMVYHGTWYTMVYYGKKYHGIPWYMV